MHRVAPSAVRVHEVRDERGSKGGLEDGDGSAERRVELGPVVGLATGGSNC